MGILILDLNVLDKKIIMVSEIKDYHGIRSYEQEDVVLQSALSLLYNQVMTPTTLCSQKANKDYLKSGM